MRMTRGPSGEIETPKASRPEPPKAARGRVIGRGALGMGCPLPKRLVVLGSVVSWPPYGIGQTIMFLPCGFFFLPSSFFPSPILSRRMQIGCLPYLHSTWCGLSANLACRSETCCMRLAENTGHKKSSKMSSAHHRTTCRAISSQLRHVSTMGENLLSSNTSSTCPHNMVNFGLY